MQCLKCGREIPFGHVFCEDCLADMEKYPVKPGTHVHLPKRYEVAPAKKQYFRRPQTTPEEKVKWLRLQLWIVSVLLVLAVTLGGYAVWRAKNTVRYSEGSRAPGQNYSAAPGTATTEPAGN